MATSWHLYWAATAAPETYQSWLAALPGYRPDSTASGGERAAFSDCMVAELDPVYDDDAEAIEREFHFRPTRSWYFSHSTRDRTAAKLEVYRVAFAFLRDFPDDCLFEQEGRGRFVRRGGRLVVNESMFTHH